MKIIKNKIRVVFFLCSLMAIIASCSDMEKDYEGDALVKYPALTVTGFTPNTGRPGTVVTITGTNFGDQVQAAHIFFNDVAATDIVSYMDTEIKVKVPDSAGTGPITVSVWTHTVVTTTDFIYLPGAAVTSLSPATAAAGDHITITGTGFGTDPAQIAVKFTGNAVAQIVSVTDTAIEVIAPADGLTGIVTVTVGIQSIIGPLFTYMVNYGSSYDFSVNTEGWQNSWGGNSTITAAAGFLNVVSAGANANLMNTAMPIDPNHYKYVAVKVSQKPADASVLLALYNDGSMSAVTGDYVFPDYTLINDNIYVFEIDITNLASATPYNVYMYLRLENTANLDVIQIDWIRTYNSLNDIN